MNFLKKRDSYYGFAFLMVLVFSLFGCQTTSNTVTPESSVSNEQSAPAQTETETGGNVAADTIRKGGEKVVTEKSISEVQKRPIETKKLSQEEFEKELFQKWSGFLGHGGVTRVNSAEETAKENTKEKVNTASEAGETKSFPELEKKVVGKWLNEKETESMEFFANKNIIINELGSPQVIRGIFRFTEKERLTVIFDEGFLKVPSMSFKITLSENEFTLIGEKDNVPTTYKRVK